MSERQTYFVDVLLPLPLSQTFTYRVPFEMNELIQPFIRVIVPFGKGKLYTGIVVNIHETAPSLYQAKYVEYVLDEFPIVSKKQYNFWKWMSDYYLAPIGDILNAALPTNLKLASETKVVIHPDFEGETTNLSDREYLVYEALEIKEVLDLREISEIIGIQTIHPLIKSMLEKRIILTLEEVSQKFSPKTGIFAIINDAYLDEEMLNQLFESMAGKSNSTKQQQALLTILKSGGIVNGIATPILRKDLERLGCSISVLKTLEKNGILRFEKLEISRIGSIQRDDSTIPNLSNAQNEALKEIEQAFQEKNTVLLQGITGSGKTEIYIHLIQKALDKNQQVLFLVPEIALTTQLIQRLTIYFGTQIGVYHSKFSANERVEIWNEVMKGKDSTMRLIVGARSSIFLPFQELGLVIVDEEHETSYKQHEPSPRYNGRDMAIVLAHFFKAKTLLGSATPSLETYFNAQEQKYGLVALTERFSQVELPVIYVTNMKEERRQKLNNGHFSSYLLQKIEETLADGEQIILFQNRRGYTPIWSCEICGFSPNCTNCDTTLNYHKHLNILKCHHCSYQTSPIGTCPACGSNRLKMLGFGTEKIEDDLSLILPNIKLGRMDFDTTRTKNSHLEIIQAFENKAIDILIGTQMIAKGLDFSNVGLVGILDADLLLNKTDFRAFERAFQLLTQVAGRSGRSTKQGKVVIQTGNPEHWVIQKVIEHDYNSFAKHELIERKNYHYPPYYKLIRFTLKHREKELVDKGASEFSKLLRSQFFERVIGPEYPVIARIQNFYLKEIILKIEAEAPQNKVKERISELTNQFFSVPQFKPIRLLIDVDPA